MAGNLPKHVRKPVIFNGDRFLMSYKFNNMYNI